MSGSRIIYVKICHILCYCSKWKPEDKFQKKMAVHTGCHYFQLYHKLSLRNKGDQVKANEESHKIMLFIKW